MTRWPRIAGAVLQGCVLGVLVVFAILVLLGFEADARLFRYQGY
jgi:hypothetical protein